MAIDSLVHKDYPHTYDRGLAKYPKVYEDTGAVRHALAHDQVITLNIMHEEDELMGAPLLGDEDADDDAPVIPGEEDDEEDELSDDALGKQGFHDVDADEPPADF